MFENITLTYNIYLDKKNLFLFFRSSPETELTLTNMLPGQKLIQQQKQFHRLAHTL